MSRMFIGTLYTCVESIVGELIHNFTSFFKELGVEELSECVQDFYQKLSEYLHTQFKGTT